MDIKGNWIILTDCANKGIYCSNCNTKIFEQTTMPKKKLSHFCPNCGSKNELFYNPTSKEFKENKENENMQIDDGNILIENTIGRINYCIQVCNDTDDQYQNEISDGHGVRINLCDLSAINSTLQLAKDIINIQNKIITEHFGGL